MLRFKHYIFGSFCPWGLDFFFCKTTNQTKKKMYFRHKFEIRIAGTISEYSHHLNGRGVEIIMDFSWNYLKFLLYDGHSPCNSRRLLLLK